MDQSLDLYEAPRHPWRWFGVATAALVVVALVMYQWMTSVTPVSQDRALDIFRADRSVATGDRRAATSTHRPKGAAPQRKEKVASHKDGKGLPQPRGAEAMAAESAPDAAAQESASPPPTQARSEPRSERAPLPAEGVYSWDTQGHEEVGGARRSFPAETQRIITRDENGWHEHHYFSEERESWTDFQVTDKAAAIAMQRNKVTFGPVTEDAVIQFSPVMLVGPYHPEVGQTWEGSWTGKTYGDYTGRVFDHSTMAIGGEEVETWAVQIDIEMKGEQEGHVQAKVWMAPEYFLTVHEEYVQDVKADVGTYHAEWSMTLKSLKPQT
jgi:hypothetical protein